MKGGVPARLHFIFLMAGGRSVSDLTKIKNPAQSCTGFYEMILLNYICL